MKTGVLFLLLLSLISNIYSYEINDIKPNSKTIPSASKTIPAPKRITSDHGGYVLRYVTNCKTNSKYDVIPTEVPNKSNIPIYTATQKAYEYCTVTAVSGCHYYESKYDSDLKEEATYIPVACEDNDLNQELLNNQDIEAIGDPNQKDIPIPEKKYENRPIADVYDYSEYIVHDKTLHCFNKHYGYTKVISEKCTTTLDPVEIKTESIPMTVTSSTKIVPSTKNVQTPPSKVPRTSTITTTTTTTTRTKTIPSTTTTSTTKRINSYVYHTECVTNVRNEVIPTEIPLNSNKSNAAIYTVIPKTYEVCTEIAYSCKRLQGGIIYEPAFLEKATYTPVACEDNELYQELLKNQYIETIGDPNQEDIPKPGDKFEERPIFEVFDYPEYVINDKTLYCYNKHYGIGTKFHEGNPCTIVRSVELINGSPVTTTTSFSPLPTTITKKTDILTPPPKVPRTSRKDETTTISDSVTMTPSVITTTSITTTKTISTKTVPNTITTTTTTSNTVKGTSTLTQCSTLKSYISQITELPLTTSVPYITVYTAIPKTYDVCTEIVTPCKAIPYNPYGRAVEKGSYIPIACQGTEFYKELLDKQLIDDVADPNQKDVPIPETQYNDNFNKKGSDHIEYIIHDRILYCYRKEYKTVTTGPGTLRGCTTTFKPVEIGTESISITKAPTSTTTTSTKNTNDITPPPKVPRSSTTTIETNSTKTVPNTSKTIPNTSKTIPNTSKTIPNTSKTIPNTSKTIPNTSKTIPNTSKTIPNTSKTIPISTKTIPSTLCNRSTITITEKEMVTITEKETVTVTVKGSSTSIGDKQPYANCSPKYGQCGGQGYKGPTCCQSGTTCRKLNEWYSQCF